VVEKLQHDSVAKLYCNIKIACSFVTEAAVLWRRSHRFQKDKGILHDTVLPEGSTTNPGFCQISGLECDIRSPCHIIPFFDKADSRTIDAYRDFVKALLGPEAFEALLSDIMGEGKDTDGGVNRLDNRLFLSPHYRVLWEQMLCYLSVDWSTYREETGEV
jgi:hypothetical protein